MPIIKSAAKRMRQEATRKARNRVYKDELRKYTKQLQDAVKSKNAKKAQDSLIKLQSHIDKLVKKNLLHSNTAARKKSQAVKLAKTAGAKTTPAAKKTTTAKTPAKKAAPAKKTTTKKTAAKSTAKKTAAKKSTTKKS